VKTITCDGDRVAKFVARELAIKTWSNPVGIGIEEDGEMLAGVVYDYFNGRNICMHVAAVEGKRWMTREFLWYCFFYPFVQLGCDRVTGLVPESNLDARRFDEHLGFKLETRLQDAHPDGDLLVYKMMKQDCRFLERRHGKA
jgi:hypothetical protein